MDTFDGDLFSGKKSGMGLPTSLRAGILAALLLGADCGAVPPAAPAGKLFRYSLVYNQLQDFAALETGEVRQSVIQKVLSELRL